MKLAFAGNPNSGKTTLFNALTGRNEKVGNWAGVTVDKKESYVKKAYAGDKQIIAIDLPGTYSLSPFTGEERVTGDYIRREKPDVLVNIVDATNLSRSLFFTTQLLELGIPMVVALNKTDLNEKNQTNIDLPLLSQKLGCPVVETVSTQGRGLDDLMAAVADAAKTSHTPMTPISDRERFRKVGKIVSAVENRTVQTAQTTWQDKFDAVLTHPVVGLPIFALVMFLVFAISQAWVGPWLAEGYTFANGFTIPGFVTLIDGFKDLVASLLVGADPFLAALLTEGILGGVSAVVGFLPLVMVLYFLVALLEDCGYMARATVVLDPIFKKVGLSGKSVIPFVVGTGCAIPGVMAARTIRDETERNATAMLTPFMPCGAKLPVIALFAGAFFPEAGWVGSVMYFVGIGIILIGAVLVNRIAGCKRRTAFFIIELPTYKAPSVKRAAVSMLGCAKSYLAKAASVILLCNTVVYCMQAFTWQLQPVAEGMAQTSILASVADPVAILLVPVVGVTAWQLAAAAVTGFIAKENVVGTLAVCFGISNLISTEELALMEGAGTEVAAVFGITKVAALAYLVLNLFTPPCFAALGAMRAELQSRKWFWGGVALQLATGYSLAYLVYTFGTLITAPQTLNLTAAMAGGIFVAAFAGVLTVLCIKAPARKKVSV